jgi:Putative NAD(P)-binding
MMPGWFHFAAFVAIGLITFLTDNNGAFKAKLESFRRKETGKWRRVVPSGLPAERQACVSCWRRPRRLIILTPAANRTFFALESDAFVTVVSPSKEGIHPAVAARIQAGLIYYKDREFIEEDLTTFHKDSGPYNTEYKTWPVDMVLSCIDDPIESRRIAILSRNMRIPVNCADIPDL